MKDIEVKLRQCEFKDMKVIYDIVNDLDVRKKSFTMSLIPYKEHVKWYKNSLNDNNKFMYVLEENKMIVGQIRMDKHNDEATISYSIEKNSRNKGYGSKLLNLIKYEAIKNNISIIEGFVKKDNIASIKAFRKNLFIEFKEENYYRYVYSLKEMEN